MRLDDRLRVTPSPALFADLKQLLGPDAWPADERRARAGRARAGAAAATSRLRARGPARAAATSRSCWACCSRSGCLRRAVVAAGRPGRVHQAAGGGAMSEPQLGKQFDGDGCTP